MATTTKVADPQPAAPEPQADHSNVRPLLDQLESLRGDITRAANWLHGHWPTDLQAPEWRSQTIDMSFRQLRLAFLATTVAEILTARGALEDGGDVTIMPFGKDWLIARRCFGDVAVDVWAAIPIWEQAFGGVEP